MGIKRFVCMALLAALCTALAACGLASGPAGRSPAGARTPSGTVPAAGASAQAGPSATASAWDSFSGDFKAVEKNPLNEAIQYSLWLAANSDEDPGAEAAATSEALRALAAKYKALVAGKGVHYVEINGMMGMNLKTEYWICDGRFRKAEPVVDQVTVFDGEFYVQYDTAEKTGTRFTKEYATADIMTVTSGLLASLSASPYQRQKDETIGGFDCSVFFLDMELLGLKGNTLYIDKETGMIVKNQYGDPKDKDSFSVTVELFEVGGFSDDVFTVPADIAVEDYR